VKSIATHGDALDSTGECIFKTASGAEQHQNYSKQILNADNNNQLACAA